MSLRKKTTYKLDIRILDGIKKLASIDGVSVPQLLEKVFLDLLKSRGILPSDTQPLPETRGGNRTKNN